MDQRAIDELRNALQTHGSAAFPDAQGRKIMFVSGDRLSFATKPSILVAYEGQGAFLWEIENKINTFRLIEAGFSLRVAPTLADILTRLVETPRETEQTGTGVPLLEAPRGNEEEE